MGRSRRVLLVLAAVLVFCCAAAPAFAWKEGGATYPAGNMDCPACHMTSMPAPGRSGPHGNYTTATNKCPVCHTVHAASADSLKLLPGPTIRATCQACHDGTGGFGVYGTIAKRGGTPRSGHSIDTTNTVPGGDEGTGGSQVRTFGGEDGYLSCDDCHSPHASNVVAAYNGERIRFHTAEFGYTNVWATSHLLKQLPTSSVIVAEEYGADWCAGCHSGRTSGAGVHNHPVDWTVTAAQPYVYDRVPIVTADNSLDTVLGTLGLLGYPTGIWHNRGFVMPYPRTPLQTGHAPICQQCHEDSRLVGEPGAVEPAEVFELGDGQPDHGIIDKPLFQNFPHETENDFMLVETGDNLCLNCHPAATLP